MAKSLTRNVAGEALPGEWKIGVNPYVDVPESVAWFRALHATAGRITFDGI
jgi:hypothetical protein